MIVTIILTAWLGVSFVLCLALAVAARKPVPGPDLAMTLGRGDLDSSLPAPERQEELAPSVA